MQMLLLAGVRPSSGGGAFLASPALPRFPRATAASALSLPIHRHSQLQPRWSASALLSFLPPPSSSRKTAVRVSASAPDAFASSGDDAERVKLAQVSKRLEKTSRYFKRLGSLGFWGQLVCTMVAAVILSFSTLITGKISSPATFYATAAGIVAAFVSVFWSFGYLRLSDKLRRTANDPAKAPPRVEVVKSLKNGIMLNIFGMGAAILGMQATVGSLVAKALTSSAVPYYQGTTPGNSPVLALDVFLVQASANTILSHFLGLVGSLELLRSVTLPPSEITPIPKPA